MSSDLLLVSQGYCDSTLRIIISVNSFNEFLIRHTSCSHLITGGSFQAEFGLHLLAILLLQEVLCLGQMFQSHYCLLLAENHMPMILFLNTSSEYADEPLIISWVFEEFVGNGVDILSFRCRSII